MIEPVDKDTFMEQMDKSEEAPDYSDGAVKRFWDWMYKRQDGIVQVCAFPVPTENQDLDEMGDGKWIHARSIREFRDFCETHSGLWRYHVYSSVNTLDDTPDYGRGSYKQVDRLKRLTFDIETQRESYGGATKQEVWWTYQLALAEIKYISEEYGVWPMVVMSENGIHLHYKVDFECNQDLLYGKQHVYSKKITQEAMSNKYVDKIKDAAPDHITFGQDDVSDPARVMKVPGTRGIKSDSGRLCGIIHEPRLSDAGCITSDQVQAKPEDFEDGRGQRGSTDDVPEKVDTTPNDVTQDLKTKIKSYAKKDDKFRSYWLGNNDEYSSRSEAEFAFIVKMLGYGFTEQEIIDTMWASGMSKWDEEGDSYRETTIKNAIEYFDGTVVRNSENGSFEFPKE